MMSDVTALKKSLSTNCVSVCEKLLPSGKREGNEWVFDPGTGKIKVQLTGAKAGIWSWFGGDDEGGDLIDLWRWSQGITMRQTLSEVRKYLGIEDPEFVTKRQRVFKRPVKPKGRKPQNQSKAHLYLTETRNLSQEAIEKYCIAETADGSSIVFPFMVEMGDLRLCKIRVAEDGAAPKPTAKDCERILMGWHTVRDEDRQLCIVEGEIDAPSGWMYDLGMPVLSLPFGGGKGEKQKWVENDFERLAQFETIYLAVDNDTEGDLAVEELSKRLGLHRCKRVRLPRKDFNECLVEGVDRDQILTAFHAAEDISPGGLHSVSVYRDELQELFYPTKENIGYVTPFGKVGDRLRFRPGEVTIWSGMTGAGKSQILGECEVSWVQQGSVVVLASLEMHPRQSLRRMIKQCGGTGQPAPDYIDKILEWLDGENQNRGSLLIYDRVGKIKLADLLEVFLYARMRFGADQFVIDSLMRLGLMTDDYNGQEDLMTRLVDWAIEHDVHVHLVAHNRKSEDGGGRHQGIEGIKGAMEVGANAFNQIEVIRNRTVEDVEAKSARGETLSEKEEKLLGAPGVVFACNKQRNGDWEGKVGLWFEQGAYQYHDQQPGSMTNRKYVSNIQEELI